MSKRVAKKKPVGKIRVVLYLAESTFKKLEALSDRLDLHRAGVLAIAVSRFHMTELLSQKSIAWRGAAASKRKKTNQEIPEEPCPQAK